MVSEEKVVAKILTVDATRCTECGLCELACSMRNVGEFNPARSRIQVISFEPDFFRLPLVCLQCYQPACAEVCPPRAITRDEATGIVRVSAEKCDGCRLCETACPLGVIVFSPVEEKAVKCELCDGKPQCVEFCTAGALEYQEVEAAAYDRRKTAADRLRKVYLSAESTFGQGQGG